MKKYPDEFDDEIRVWVYEEEVSIRAFPLRSSFWTPRRGARHTDVSRLCANSQFEGKKLTEIINTTHENKKYLPGVQLPDNVVAVPDMKEAVDGATALVFVMPHQCEW